MARRDEGAYSLEICNCGATTPDAPPRRKTAWDIFKTRSKDVNHHLRTACDYVHLNPARAGLLRGDERLLG